jgi:hypothetical protein
MQVRVPVSAFPSFSVRSISHLIKARANQEFKTPAAISNAAVRFPKILADSCNL